MKYLEKSFKLFLALTLTSLFLTVNLSCSSNNDFTLFIPSSDSEKLTYSNKKGVQAWTFSKKQHLAVSDYVNEQGDGALLLQFTVKKDSSHGKNNSAHIGFLTDEDLNDSGKLESIKNSRSMVTFFCDENAGSPLTVVYSFPKNETVPMGFFLEGGESVKIHSAMIVRASCGFDFRGEVPLYAFTANGGTISRNLKKADFTGLPSSFNSENTDKSLMPVITLYFKPLDQTEEKISVRAVCGGEKLYIRSPETETQSVVISCASLKQPFADFKLNEGAENVEAVLVSAQDRSLLSTDSTMKNCVLLPIKTDPGLIIDWPQRNWRGRDYELFEWDRFEHVLIFDFADYAIQDDFLRRLAYFTEKKGYRGRLLKDEELAGKHGYNAHDYSAESLASFYNAASDRRFPLNKREILLKEILQANQIISVDEKTGRCTPVQGALISFSKEAPSYNRAALLAHEGWHGIFFTNEEFRNVSASLFYTMDRGSLDFLFKYFETYPNLEYDTEDEYLMKNELMSYMLQRPVSECGNYYVRIANWEMMQTQWENECNYIIKTNGEGFTACAELFDQYVNSTWNLNAGRIGLISR